MSNVESEFIREDIIPKNSFLGRFGRAIGLTRQRKPGYRGLSWLVIISLAALSLVSYLEGRFDYGSVTADLPGVGTILGMSFLGDTMVWPYIFLVPVCLVLTIKAVDRTVALLNLLCQKVDGVFKGSAKPKDYDPSIGQVKDIFNGRAGQAARLIRALPWFLAIVFWSYNTVTCGFNHFEIIPYPYTSHRVVVVDIDSSGQQERRTLYRSSKQVLPKWDADWPNAPMSTSLTRAWTLIFYSLLPFIMVKLIQMVWGLTYFIKRFKTWMDDGYSVEHRKIQQNSQLVNPFAEDGYGGLSAIAETGMLYFYTAIGFVLLISMSFFKEGPDPSWHNYALITLLVPVALVVFLVPVLQAREIMKNAKKNYLSYICTRLNLMFEELDQSLQPSSAHKLNPEFHANLSAMKMFHDKVAEIQEWPFSSSVVFRVALVMLAPFSGILINIFVTRIMG